MHNRLFFRLFGAVFFLVSFVVWMSSEIKLPTKHPPTEFHFTGFAQIMLGLPPFLLGVVLYWLADKPQALNGRFVQLSIGCAIGILGLAFFLSKSY